MSAACTARPGVLVVGHGERGGRADNRSLLALVERIQTLLGSMAVVRAAVLNGDPGLELGIADLAREACDGVIAYPLFMSDGFFTREELPRLLTKHCTSLPWQITSPLGLENEVPSLIARRSLMEAGATGWPLHETRLLIVGHGSSKSRAPAERVNAVATELRRQMGFACVEAAFLEEAPFLHEQIASRWQHSIVVGFFSGEGLHAREDVPAALVGTSANYLGAVGGWPEIAALVASQLHRAIGLI